MDYFQVWNTGYGPDSFVYIRLSYTDGDGDLGLNEDDTTGAFGYGQPDFYNLQVLMYEKKKRCLDQADESFGSCSRYHTI